MFQAAYLTPQEIAASASTNPIESLSKLAADTGILSYAEQSALFAELWAQTQTAFNAAAAEPKIGSRQSMLDRLAVPVALLPAAATPAAGADGAIPVPAAADAKATLAVSEFNGTLTAPGLVPAPAAGLANTAPVAERAQWSNVQTRVAAALAIPRVEAAVAAEAATGTRDVMRKHMTRVFDELMTAYPNMAYLGEDVIHGGYYLVTEGLATKYPQRVRDFPPDETSLVGAGMGFAQTGLLPVVEIPYAKYLDCAADMFYELALSSWLSNTKQPNGMIVRLQGFGKGVFGGNFHTHNTLYLPPGIDTVRRKCPTQKYFSDFQK